MLDFRIKKKYSSTPFVLRVWIHVCVVSIDVNTMRFDYTVT